MVAVFDQNDDQMPFFQGKREEAMPKIKRRLNRQKGLVHYKVNNRYFTPTGEYDMFYG